VIRVGIVGFGTIGKRVADAVTSQPDMTVAGVAKRRPTGAAEVAVRRGFSLYAGGAPPAFESADLDVAGTKADLVDESDVVVDATPAGVGAEHRDLYEATDTPAIYQGGEDGDVAETTFVAGANYEAGRSAASTRVASCNTTGLARLLSTLDSSVGVADATVTIVRRGADPGTVDRGPIDDILPDPVGLPSHHAGDLRTVLPDVEVATMAMKVPATVMHLHAVEVTLGSRASVSSIRDLLADEPRIALLPGGAGFDGCGSVRELGRDLGRPRGDVWENCVWTDSMDVSGGVFRCFQAIHQESIVVPENVDAIRALVGDADGAASRERTNRTLGVGLDLSDKRVPA